MIRRAALALSFLLLQTAPRPARAEVTLRFASLAPEGSSWMKLFHQWQRAVETRTEGRVKVRFYAGGAAGDERDVLRKIKLGQLSGAAVTSIGLTVIDPEVRALEVARTYPELDGLRARLAPLLERRFAERGFLLLGWGDVGPIHFFSQKPIRTIEDLQSTRPWLWSDDPLSRKLFDALGLHGVPMGVPDVLPALSTGAVDSFFGSPLSTLALQWGGHAKYMTELVMSQATGATVVAKAQFEKLGAADQAIVLEESAKMQSLVLAQVRKDNDVALEALKRHGLRIVPTPIALQKELQRRGEKVALETGKTFSREMQSEMKKIIEDYQALQKQQ